MARFVSVAFVALFASGGGVRAAQTGRTPTGDAPAAALSWQPCAEDLTLNCATLRVPVDHLHPEGEQFGMAVIRARSTAPVKRLGVLVANPGGPGLSGIEFLMGGLRRGGPIVAKLRERFDLVSFDPRGVGRSQPVRCAADLPPAPAGQGVQEVTAYLDELGRRYAAACRAQAGPFVFSLDASNVARDVDLLRRSLGEAQISFVGIFFNTQLGAVYASMYPQRLRALVLDAGIAPGMGGSGLLNFRMEHTASFDMAFHRLDLLCRQDPACKLHIEGVVRTFDELSTQLKAKPIQANGFTLTQSELDRMVGSALYREASWPAIVDALHGIRSGDTESFLKLRTSVRQAAPRDYGALMPMLCGAYSGRMAPARTVAVDAAFTAAHPLFFGRGVPTLADDRFGVAFATALCSAWPEAEKTSIRNVRGEIENAPLLLASSFDNATPTSWSDRLAAALGFEGPVLRYKGGGHGLATSGNPCTDDAIVDYLVERRLPEPGATCAARPVRFAR